MADENKSAEVILLPKGRLINSSLFVMDQFNEQAAPSYKAEIAFPKGELDGFFNKCLDVAVEKWGKDVVDRVIIPIKDGDEMAAKREAKGKSGEAYIGQDVIRANTIFNRHGEKGPGGIQVFDQDKTLIEAVNQDAIYNGCYVIAAVNIGTYVNNEGAEALTRLTVCVSAGWLTDRAMVAILAVGNRVGLRRP